MDFLLPRLLVCDDDPGIIAGYKLVLDPMKHRADAGNVFGLHDAEHAMFGDALLPGHPVLWNIDYVMSGEDAVDKVRKSIAEGYPYSAIFLDIRMPPGIDGYEAAKQIRAIDKSIHIVIVTAYSDYSVEDFEDVAGPDQALTFLMKPVWPEDLSSIARNFARSSAPAKKKAS